jgi:hypothetical protein
MKALTILEEFNFVSLAWGAIAAFYLATAIFGQSF